MSTLSFVTSKENDNNETVFEKHNVEVKKKGINYYQLILKQNVFP